MLYSKKTDYLMESIRLGREMDRREKLNLIVGLSIPSMLAQISTVMMFFIDASMVGHLGAEASASIGLIESTTWLIGSLLSAAATGFSVQVAHFIGANDFANARQVFRHALICGVAFSIFVSLLCVGIHAYLPYWLGGGADIATNSSRYFLIYGLVLPFVFLYHISEMMLKSAGNMHTPSVMAVLICICDVVFNYLFIYILKLGVVGAALGTAMAYVCISLPNLYLAGFKNKILNLRQDHVRFRWVRSYVHNACKISIPIAIQNILMSGYEDQALLGSDFLTAGEDAACVVLHHSVILCTNNTLGDDLFLRDIHVVTLVGLCSRGDDRLWETLVLAHTVWQLHTADLAAALLILAPCTTGEDRTDDHLHAETFALQTYGNHWVWSSQLPVWTDVCSCVQELSCNLIEHLSFERDTFRQNNVER